MKISFYLSIIIFIFFSCSNDEDVPPFFELSCLGTANAPVSATDCENFPFGPQICEAVHVGDYLLEEDSRSYLQQFCREIGDVEVFVNENGERVNLEIILKTFINSHSVKNTFIPCANDSTKTIGACIGLELALLKMRSADSIIELSLQLSTKLSVDNPLEDKVGDYLDISRAIGNNTFVQDFSIIVNERNIGVSQTPNQENLGTIDLMGKSFDDVLSSDISAYPDPKPFKYYYNQRFGLIAFEDSDGVLWRVEE